ncbi:MULTISPECIES: helix-turn-helix domain-containing protein [unclassified Variovorax]|uniref:helix-turn-helix domain-containing protein n=1 Tax=unclassified Variovorax TaxID=663243 RepID=UPI003ECE74D8
MDQDSGIRAAFPAAFVDRIKERTADGWYVSVLKETTIHDKEAAVKLARDRLKAEAEAEVRPGLAQVQDMPAPAIAASELIALRESLHLSRPVFARYLRTNPRTLENWEQGHARPNAQAALLIRLVQRFPDTVDRLASV